MTKEEKIHIGSTLKNLRIASDISLDKASRDTKIAKSYLSAIEEENFYKIPGEVVIKGFLQIYSGYLGADPKHILSEFKKRMKKEPSIAPEQKKQQKAKSLPVDISRIAEKIPDARRFIKPAVSIVVVLFAFWVLSVLASLIMNNASVIVETTQNPVSQSSAINLEVQILDRTWIRIVADGKPVFEGELYKGASKVITASTDVYMKIGNAAAVKVVSGEKVLLEPGGRGQVITKEFKK